MPIADLLADLAYRVGHQMDDITQRLARIERRQARIEQAVTANTVNDIIDQEAIMANFDQLHADVEANGDAVDSAVTLLNDLSARIADAADDPAEIQAIAAELSAQSTSLAEAVAANTPAAPDTPVDETPVDDGTEPA